MARSWAMDRPIHSSSLVGLGTPTVAPRGSVGETDRSSTLARQGILSLVLLVLIAGAGGAQDPPAESAEASPPEKEIADLWDEVEDFFVLGQGSQIEPPSEARNGSTPRAGSKTRSDSKTSASTRARKEARRRSREKESSTEVEFGGHLKLQGLASTYPDDSLLRELWDATSLDSNVDVRVNSRIDFGRIDLVADAQLVGLFGDQIEGTRAFGLQSGAGFLRFQDDAMRAVDLTKVHRDRGRSAFLSRFDRLSIGYTGSRNVLRLGRQAVTWGNGFAYTPMDIFNPFDPAAVDKEFKPGDDMVYGQHLLSRGDDVQLVWVGRRDALGELDAGFDSPVGSVALKYHGLFGSTEVDVLLARHYGDDIYGLGGTRSLGGAVWRGDVVVTDSELDTTVSAVSGLTYSWVLGGKNFSGFLEAHYNGFGQSNEDYSPSALAANIELQERLVRRELFTLGRRYLAASTTIELTPLFLVTPNLFFNADDSSGLVQIVGQNDLSQSLLLQTAISFPFGGSGTEFGGVPSGVPGRFLSSGPQLFVQLARYF